MAHDPRWYQEEAVCALFDYFRDNIGYDANYVPIPRNPLVAMPTGTGKSHVIGEFIRRAMALVPNTRIFMGTHVKELIEQNAKKLLEAWPHAPLGIYSAGLKSRDTMQPIIFGGVKSAVGKFPIFARRDLLVIDEAHLVGTSTDTMWIEFIHELRWGTRKELKPHEYAAKLASYINSGGAVNYNPYLKVIGLTATPYRLGVGCMTNGGIFTDVVYNLCTIDGFTRLIAEGFLCPLIPKKTQTELDTSNVGMRNGDFAEGELQKAVDKHEVTYAALTELVAEGWNRRSWLVFATGVEHAEHICEMLNSAFGIPTGIVHSKRSDKENTAALEAWKRGETRAIVNMNSLTTGVDHPACDLIGMLRPTMSPGLWVQMLGRGTRPFTGKANCLVLDFAGNTRRLGPINDPVIPRPKGSGPPGDAPVKICKQCGAYNHTSAKVCFLCGTEFPAIEKLSRHADTSELIRSELPQMEYYNVERMILSPHISKSSGRASIKVAYYCAGAIPRTFFEYKSVQSLNTFYRHRSRDWFRQVYANYHLGEHEFNDKWEGDCPSHDSTVIELSQQGKLRKPTQIKVWVNKNPPEIMGYEF